MKIELGRDNDNDLVLTFDNEDQLGTFIKAEMDDHTGLKLVLDLATFYSSKGHNMRRLLDSYLSEFEVETQAPAAEAWTWRRFFQFLRGK